MKFQGAVVKEQGITFAVVIVNSHVVNSPSESNSVIQSFGTVFPGMPIVLMAQNIQGAPTYFGRSDIVKFLANVHISQIPWKEFTVS